MNTYFKVNVHHRGKICTNGKATYVGGVMSKWASYDEDKLSFFEFVGL